MTGMYQRLHEMVCLHQSEPLRHCRRFVKNWIKGALFVCFSFWLCVL